jgi:putative transposase
MAKLDTNKIRRILDRTLPLKWLEETARRVGALRRQRKVILPLLVSTLVLAFASSSRERTLAAFRTSYEAASGDTIEESSFYDRFTGEFVKLMQEAFNQALESARGISKRLEGHIRQFVDVLITDSSVIRLHKKLKEVFPGARNNHSPAALKLHAVLNVRGISDLKIRLSAGKKADLKMFRIGRDVAGKLLLFDLGYFSYNLFNRIRRAGGWFISRLKDNANPLIVGLNLTHRGRQRPIVGRRLRDVLKRLKRDIIDIQVTVEFELRAYNGDKRKATAEYRVVGLRNPLTGEYHLFITNIPPSMLSAEEVAQSYRYRWEIELMFKELKYYYHIEELNTSNEHVIMALLYAALISWILSRRIRHAVLSALPRRLRRVPARRFAARFAQVAVDLLDFIAQELGIKISRADRCVKALLDTVIDPNVKRRPTMSALGC